MSGCSFRVLLASLCGAALAVLAGPDAANAGRLRVGVQKSGTFGWELAVIRARGFDREAGLDIDVVDLASTEAGKVAMAGGAVDVALLDWLWVSRERGLGHRLVFSPYSSAAGSVMVPAASPARDLAGLKGLSLGVAGGPLDKSWLLLQAYAARGGLDLPHQARVLYGAPPLLAEKAADGEIDATLQFWNFSAALERRGFRSLVDMRDVERSLGASGPVAMVGFVFDEALAADRAADVAALLSASRRAKEVLAADPAAWPPVMAAIGQPPEAAETFRLRYAEGVPRRPLAEERRDAGLLYATLAKAGGPALTGPAEALDAGTYYDPGRELGREPARDPGKP